MTEAIENGSNNFELAAPAVPTPPDSTPEFEYPRRFQLYIVTLALALSVLIVGLVNQYILQSVMLADNCYTKDANFVATATPQITDTFNSLDDVGWYGSA